MGNAIGREMGLQVVSASGKAIWRASITRHTVISSLRQVNASAMGWLL